MSTNVLFEESKIARTIKELRRDSFTVMDFAEAVQDLYPEDWRRLVKRFGKFGEGVYD